jgi:hypothetical protein
VDADAEIGAWRVGFGQPVVQGVVDDDENAVRSLDGAESHAAMDGDADRHQEGGGAVDDAVGGEGAGGPVWEQLDGDEGSLEGQDQGIAGGAQVVGVDAVGVEEGGFEFAVSGRPHERS